MKHLFFLFLFLSTFAFAQNSNLKVKDLVASRADFTNSITGTRQLSVDFKLNNPAQAQSVTVQIGSTQGASDVLQTTATFTDTGNGITLNLNGKSWSVTNLNAHLLVNYPTAQTGNAKFLSLVIQDLGGQTTQTINYQL